MLKELELIIEEQSDKGLTQLDGVRFKEEDLPLIQGFIRLLEEVEPVSHRYVNYKNKKVSYSAYTEEDYIAINTAFRKGNMKHHKVIDFLKKYF